eukprot:GAHX01001438.1.p1 GENE.GAHX01001438.1~~GAHX01001438.1.p1  ORF type:complete len:497 (+),score=61.05 GAHX01001438.1:650-2140(+)
MGVLYQTDVMKMNYIKYGEVGILDSTFKLTTLNWTFFMFIGVDENLKSVPFFSFIIHNESFAMLREVFEIFSSHNDVTKTSYMITDKDLSERKVIKSFFPNASLNICRFHTIKTFTTRIQRLTNTNKATKEENQKIIKQLCYLENADLYYNLVHKFHPIIKDYYYKNWHDIRSEFIPCFKKSSLYFDINTTNNVESYFNTVKKEIPLHQPLGNFLIAISNFFEYKYMANIKTKRRKGKRVPNREINPLIRKLKSIVSNYAFDTLIDIETSSHFISSSQESFKFDLQQCCNFKRKFGLPCSHVFYNMRRDNNLKLEWFINGRWKIETCDEIISKPMNTTPQTKQITNKKRETNVECEDSKTLCETKEEIETRTQIQEYNYEEVKVEINSSETKMQRRLKYKHFKVFSKKIASILAEKNISKINGTEILKNIITIVEDNETEHIFKKLKPNVNIIVENNNKQKNIARKLLDENIEANNNQKGRKKNLSYKIGIHIRFF